MKYPLLGMCTVIAAAFVQHAVAQDFDAGGDTFSYSDASNWTPSAPLNNGSADISISSAPTGFVFFDLGTVTSVNSITIDNGIGQAIGFIPASGTTLSVGGGGLNNLSGFELTLGLGTTFTSNSNWIGAGSSFIFDSGLGLGNTTQTISSGSASISSIVDLTINSLVSYGNISGSGELDLSGANLTLNFTSSSFSIGDSLNLFNVSTLSGSLGGDITFSGSISGSLTPDMVENIGGLDWLYSSSTGTLSVVPEPTVASLFGAAAVAGLLRRRRRQG